MKTFNEWMNEELKIENNGGTYKRFEMFQIGRAPHPMTQAEHVWNACSSEYTLRLDKILTKVSMLASDIRAVTLIKELKEEMIKTMISNSVGFTKDGEEPPKLNLV